VLPAPCSMSSSASSSSSYSAVAAAAAVTVNAPRLTATNYGQWKSRMEAYLMRHGILDVCKDEISEWKELVVTVEGWDRDVKKRLISSALMSGTSTSTSAADSASSPKPEASSKEEVEMRKQVKELVAQSQKAYAILYEAVPDDIRPQVAHLAQGYAYGLWKWLEQKYQSTEVDTVNDRIKQWMEMRMEHDVSFDAYRARVNEVYRLLETAKEKPSARQYSYTLLDKLQARYKQAVLALKASDKLKDTEKINWDEVSAFINAAERDEVRMEGGSPEDPSRLMALNWKATAKESSTDKGSREHHLRSLKDVQCFGCQEYGHLARNCQKKERKQKKPWNKQGNRTGSNSPRDRSPSSNRGSGSQRDDSPASGPGGASVEGLRSIKASRNPFELLRADAEDKIELQSSKNNKVKCDESDGSGIDRLHAMKIKQGGAQKKSLTVTEKKKTSESAMSFGIDSHASIHATGRRKLFINLKRCPTMFVEVANSQLVACQYKGTIQFTIDGITITIHNVYYHESFSTNLLSWCCLKAGGWSLHSDEKESYVITPEKQKLVLLTFGKVLTLGNASLTSMGPSLKLAETIHSNRGKVVYTSVDDLMRAHERFNHVGFDSLLTFIKAGAVEDGLELRMDAKILEVAKNKIRQCKACTEGKGSRPPYGHSGLDRGQQPGECLHMDSFHVALPDRRKEYGLVVVDPYLEKGYFVTAYTKDEHNDSIIKRILHHETQTGKKVKRLYMDGGSELINAKLRSFCNSETRGTEIHISPPRTPALNGIAESYVKIFKGGINTLLHHANLPTALYWKYAGVHFEYVRNRTHIAKATGKTPYEAIRGTKPNVSYLGIFGCDVYCVVPKELRVGNTFKAKMEPGIYLGHSERYNCSMVQLLLSKKVIYTRNVDFREYSFTHAKALLKGTDEAIQGICGREYIPEQYSSAEENENKDDDIPARSEVNFELASEINAKSGPGPDEILEDGTKLYIVESILRDEVKAGKRRYLVKWQGYSDEENTWEPIESLRYCSDKLKEYQLRVKQERKLQEVASRSEAIGSRTRARQTTVPTVTPEEKEAVEITVEKDESAQKANDDLRRAASTASDGGQLEEDDEVESESESNDVSRQLKNTIAALISCEKAINRRHR
jgi:hypothetical protein